MCEYIGQNGFKYLKLTAAIIADQPIWILYNFGILHNDTVILIDTLMYLLRMVTVTDA